MQYSTGTFCSKGYKHCPKACEGGNINTPSQMELEKVLTNAVTSIKYVDETTAVNEIFKQQQTLKEWMMHQASKDG